MDPILGPENGPDSGARKRTRSWVQKMSTNLCPENGPDSGARKWTAFWVQKMDTNLGPENGRNFKPAFLNPQNRILGSRAQFLDPESGPFSGTRIGFVFWTQAGCHVRADATRSDGFGYAKMCTSVRPLISWE